MSASPLATSSAAELYSARFLVVSDEPPLRHSIPRVCTVYRIISENRGLTQREQATAAPTKAPLNSSSTDRSLVT